MIWDLYLELKIKRSKGFPLLRLIVCKAPRNGAIGLHHIRIKL